MVRLNKTHLSTVQLNELLKQFDNVVGKVSAKKATGFLKDLLGKEERIMLAKRLAIIILLLEKQSLYKISNTLKVSTASADKVRRKLDDGDYKNIINLLSTNKKDYASIIETLDLILHFGGIMPHYNGRDRYKNLK